MSSLAPRPPSDSPVGRRARLSPEMIDRREAMGVTLQFSILLLRIPPTTNARLSYGVFTFYDRGESA